MVFYKYSGAGNTFMIADGRVDGAERFKTTALINQLCTMNGTDGVIFLTKSDTADFRMEFYNPDGTTGMMCGNGGRCIIAFARSLGIRASWGKYVFEAGDGMHTGEILSDKNGRMIVRLGMRDVTGYGRILDGFFLNTGARHFVKFVDDVQNVDVANEGKELRWHPAFSPKGANVDFVSLRRDGSLDLRTFEKGVEAETLACGTGITAAALAAWCNGISPSEVKRGRQYYYVHAREDVLTVDFIPADPAREIFLTGPAERK